MVGLAIDQIAQSGLSSLSVIYYSAQLFSESVITRVAINNYNALVAYPGGLVSSQQLKGSDLDGYFVFIPSYIKDAVYFNFIEPSNVRVYKFHHIPGYVNSAADISKVSDSYGEWVKKNGDIIVSKDEIIEGKGRVGYGAIITPDGKEKCKFDSGIKAWVLTALASCE
ncbi:hypothetical protein KAM546c_17890 [Enterobacter roggenkampii]|nr:hypothetical protein KAM546c_17890 [Enterobacter roggenkampii]